VYLVGSPGLGDFSPRQSNLDLVAVTSDPLPPETLRVLSRSHRRLQTNGREAAVGYTTWDGLDRPPSEAAATVFLGSRATPADRLANPMTWAILGAGPLVLHGPRPPAVHTDADQVRAWFREQLPQVVDRTGRLLWRRHLARTVLQTARCAHGALTGEVVSLRRAGELTLPGAAHTAHRVLVDALGYREGANTSMYWGPFERKSNAVTLASDLMRKVQAERG
jgi:hypothetical protein